MGPLELVNLSSLMRATCGKPDVVIGLIDGPVAVDHPGLAADRIRKVPGKLQGACSLKDSVACAHGTFVAGILSAKRRSYAPGISPECTLLVCPIFAEALSECDIMPSATPEELSEAIFTTIDAGARLINLSAALIQPSAKGKTELKESLDYAMRRGVIVIAAAGNQGTIGGTVITNHPWVIPVVACNPQGLPLYSNLGASIGAHGLGAPGENITSLGTDDRPLTFSGTSAATPFVTGAIALLWSEFPNATASQMKLAVSQTHTRRKKTIVPPLMDAGKTFQIMATTMRKGDRWDARRRSANQHS